MYVKHKRTVEADLPGYLKVHEAYKMFYLYITFHAMLCKITKRKKINKCSVKIYSLNFPTHDCE